MKTEFDWEEIQSLTSDKQSQLILLYSLYLDTLTITNKAKHSAETILSNGRFEISKKLYFYWKDYRGQLDSLSYRGLVTRYGDTYFTAYKCNYPQSYINNMKFIYEKASVHDKTNYVHMIAMRKYNNTNYYIPSDYVPKSIAMNPFTLVKNKKIYFTLENN